MNKKSIGIYALVLTLLTAVVGGLMRWYLLENVMVERGIAQAGSHFPLAMAIVVVACLVGICVFTCYMENRPSYSDNFGNVTNRQLYAFLTLCGVCLALTGVLRLKQQQPALETANFYMCILGGVTFAVFAILQMLGRRPHVLLLLPFCIFTLLQLVCDYRAWSGDPLMLDYCYTLLADVVSMLAIFQLGGFCFDKGKRRITAFWCSCGVVLNAISLADAIHVNTLSDIAYRSAMTLLLLVLLYLFCTEAKKSEA